MRMRRFIPLVAVALGGAWLALAAHAQSTAGTVTRIDRAQQRIELRHEAIKSLDMPAMRMWYRVKDPALLEGLKEGSTVHFDAEKVNGQFVVTRLGP